MWSNESGVEDEERGRYGSRELDEDMGEVEGRLMLLEGAGAESCRGCTEGRFGGQSRREDVVLDTEHGNLASERL